MDSIQYYNKNNKAFIEDTKNVDMSDIYIHFTSRLPMHSYVLDAGCGSGRDSLYFHLLGYRVLSIDASEEMVKYTKSILINKNVEVRQINFDELNYENTFDGIWACASLLHVPANEFLSVIEKFIFALKENGVMYMSFKYGREPLIKGERYFLNFTKKSLIDSLLNFNSIKIEYLWYTGDKRKYRNSERWINCILRKI